ncbi:MAG: DNA-binding transcriptional LysR family regulator [Myxococcota bacterium]|jgi:DNA-binding transcriptional LysR family regulator
MFDRLRHFVLACEHGTFTAAARQAHISQPAFSASIRALEEDLGARLLDRGRRGARPTAAGEALLPGARAALAAVQDGRRAVAEVVGLRAGLVRLGAGPTACTYLLPTALAAFRRAHPGVRLFLTEAHNEAVWDALQGGALDLALVSDASIPAGATWFTAEPWRFDPLFLVDGPVPAADPTAFVSFPEGAILRTLLERHVPEADVVMELGSIAAVKGNVRAGVGRALMSRAACRRDLAQGRLIKVEDARFPIPRTLMLLHRGVDQLPPAASALRRQLLAGAITDTGTSPTR